MTLFPVIICLVFIISVLCGNIIIIIIIIIIILCYILPI